MTSRELRRKLQDLQNSVLVEIFRVDALLRVIGDVIFQNLHHLRWVNRFLVTLSTCRFHLSFHGRIEKRLSLNLVVFFPDHSSHYLIKAFTFFYSEIVLVFAWKLLNFWVDELVVELFQLFIRLLTFMVKELLVVLSEELFEVLSFGCFQELVLSQVNFLRLFLSTCVPRTVNPFDFLCHWLLLHTNCNFRLFLIMLRWSAFAMGSKLKHINALSVQNLNALTHYKLKIFFDVF